MNFFSYQSISRVLNILSLIFAILFYLNDLFF